jgi:hypothetical protein
MATLKSMASCSVLEKEMLMKRQLNMMLLLGRSVIRGSEREVPAD